MYLSQRPLMQGCGGVYSEWGDSLGKRDSLPSENFKNTRFKDISPVQRNKAKKALLLH